MYLYPVQLCILRTAFKRLGAVLLYNVVNLIPEQVGLLLEIKRELHERTRNRSSRSRVFSEQAVFADCFGALNVSGKGLGVAFEQALVYKPVAAAFLEP